MNIGDVFFAIRGDGGPLQVDAKKAGEAAGQAAGLAASQTLGKSFQKGLPGALSSFKTGILQGMGQQAFRGIESAISDVVNAIPDLIAKGQAYALAVHDIQEVTGASASQSSIFAGTLTSLGIPLDSLNTNFKMLSRQVATNEKLILSWGITTRDAEGVQLNMLTILDSLRGRWGAMTNAAQRNAEINKVLGKTGLDLLEYLKLSDPQVALLTSRLVAYGLVLSQDTVDAAKKAIYEQKQLDLAFTGLGVSLFTQVGPIIRLVMDNIATWVSTNGKTITDTIGTIVNAIAGLISGLTGWDTTGLSSFGDQLVALGSPGSGRVGQLSDELQTLNDKYDANAKIIKDGTKATKADTSAVDANIASVDKQIATLDKKDATAEKTFQRDMLRLAAVYGAQLLSLDADERALDTARAKEDLALQLLAAQEDLRKAQTAGPVGTIDVAAAQDARARILDIQAQQREATRVADVDARRAGLEATKAYIESIAQLETSENKKALAKNLATRRKSLEEQLAAATASGDTTAAAQLTARIEAIKTAETRTQAAIRTGVQKTELEKAKADYAELKKTITDSIGGGTSAAVTAAIEANKGLKKDIADLEDRISALYSSEYATHHGGDKAPLGAGGSLVAAWTQTAADWKTIGEGMVKSILGDGTPGSGMVGALQSLIDKANELANVLANAGLGWRYLTDETFRNMIDAQARANGMSPPSGTAGDILGWIGDVWGTVAAGPFAPPKAAGGLIHSGSSAWVGEAGIPEIATALPGGGTWITPLGGSGYGGQPAVIRLEIGGRPLLDYVDQNLAYRRRP